jgi:hypothetical protein
MRDKGNRKRARRAPSFWRNSTFRQFFVSFSFTNRLNSRPAVIWSHSCNCLERERLRTHLGTGSGRPRAAAGRNSGHARPISRVCSFPAARGGGGDHSQLSIRARRSAARSRRPAVRGRSSRIQDSDHGCRTGHTCARRRKSPAAGPGPAADAGYHSAIRPGVASRLCGAADGAGFRAGGHGGFQAGFSDDSRAGGSTRCNAGVSAGSHAGGSASRHDGAHDHS